ncbi:acyl-CoA dehydrogenase family protein [Candidatus Methylocalor cossyra]|uniref:Acyl-CoA dehydrogenase n=1 Tax=Candidatus Methylocalor cossyra TaxID=3108543 RepID=A0ABM9NN35_9GAMM
MSLPELFRVLIALAEADSNVAHILRTHFWFVEQQLQNPDPVSRSKWLNLVLEGKIFGNAILESNNKPAGLFYEGGSMPGEKMEVFETKLIKARLGDGYVLNGTKYYSTGTLFADWIVVMASTDDGNLASVTIAADRKGVVRVDDWDGFGQRLTGSGTTKFENVIVHPDEVTDYGPPTTPQPPNYLFAFVQLYLQALTAGILHHIRKDACALIHRRTRAFSHSTTSVPARDPQILQVVGEIASDAFAAEAIVIAAAEQLQAAADSVTDGKPDPELALQAQLAAACAKVAIDRFSYQVASRLFDVGGASATRGSYNLDRHWRNIRTISTHNPTFAKATAIGNYFVNNVKLPLNGYF